MVVFVDSILSIKSVYVGTLSYFILEQTKDKAFKFIILKSSSTNNVTYIRHNVISVKLIYGVVLGLTD